MHGSTQLSTLGDSYMTGFYSDPAHGRPLAEPLRSLNQRRACSDFDLAILNFAPGLLSVTSVRKEDRPPRSDDRSCGAAGKTAKIADIGQMS